MNSMIVYNDTIFLAYQLLSIPHLFSDLFLDTERKGAKMIFVDQVQLLYSFGQDALLKEMVGFIYLEYPSKKY